MKKPLKNVAASVKARLLKIRTDTGDDYNELLAGLCLERFLYRLSISRTEIFLCSRKRHWKKSVWPDPMVSLEETVSFAAGFLLPPMLESSFNHLWKPGGPWTA